MTRFTLLTRSLATLLITALMACSEATNGVGMISKRLGDAARVPGAREVDLAALTTFGWDSFHVFKPGVSRDEVCKEIHANRNVCGRVIRIERAAPDQTFIVFALGHQVTHVELHALANGQFDFEVADEWHPRSASVFKVRRNTSVGGESILLEPR